MLFAFSFVFVTWSFCSCKSQLVNLCVSPLCCYSGEEYTVTYNYATYTVSGAYTVHVLQHFLKWCICGYAGMHSVWFTTVNLMMGV